MHANNKLSKNVKELQCHDNQNQTVLFWQKGEQQLICIKRYMHENSMFLLPLKMLIYLLGIFELKLYRHI